MRVARTLLFGTFLCASGCGGGGSTSTPTAPSATPAPIASGISGTVTTQSGCAATYACPNANTSGVANPATPTFDTLTVGNGTSSSCRADLYRNSPSPAWPIDFTIRNSGPGYSWTGEESQASISPLIGGATAGPVRVNLDNFTGLGSVSSGQTVTNTLKLSLRRGSDQTIVAQCAVTLWGFIVPGR